MSAIDHPPRGGDTTSFLTTSSGTSAYDAVFESGTAGFAELDVASGRFVRVNRRFCDMTGRPAADFAAGLLGPEQVVHPEDLEADLARWRDVVATDRFRDAEKRYMRPDGSVVWAHLSMAVAERGADGRPSRCVAIVQDVTARHVAEERLRASEQMLRLTLEVGRVRGFTRDLRTGMIYCGPETREMHGLPGGDAPIPFAAFAATLVPEDRARLASEIAVTLARRDVEANFNYRFVHPADGRVRHIEARARYEYDAEGRPLSTTGAIIDVTERREAEARIAHIALHDALTGLPNRVLFRERLVEHIGRARRGEGSAVLCLDLDRFKEVNDTLGHPVGDALLRAVTARIGAELRDTDTVARLGGDEFAVIQDGSDGVAGATALARRLVDAISRPFDLDGHQVVIGTSIGIAVMPGDGLDPDALLKSADMALYRAKTEGRGRWTFFEPEMDARMQARRALEADLRRALAAGEFELHYQPIVGVESCRVSGLEGLLRWRHPTLGLAPPDNFIPLAEEIGLIVPIGEWVLERACADAASWEDAPRIAVNLSPTQFTSKGLVAAVEAALAASGLDPARLDLEITEMVMLQDTEATIATLHRLKALGLRIAMDDFGTGYSSLSYLQRFPFDKVKIDRSFIGGLDQSCQSDAIVRAVAGLCSALGMSTTAEGVETKEQFVSLRAKGCSEAQGYLFSRPIPADLVPGLLAEMGRKAAA